MAKKINMLLAEDEPALGQIIKESLETRDFNVSLVTDGVKALEIYKSKPFDVLVLDVMMPKKDGFTLAQEIRQEDDTIPIIFLTAKSQTQDVVEGFSKGGNDYLKKPFSMEELIVRIHNLLHKRIKHTEDSLLQIGHFVFDLPKQTLQFKDHAITRLTHREAHLLYDLIKHKNRVLDRTVVLKKLWGSDDFFAARSMDVYISKLRKKLAQDHQLQIINVRGFGYKLTD